MVIDPELEGRGSATEARTRSGGEPMRDLIARHGSQGCKVASDTLGVEHRRDQGQRKRGLRNNERRTLKSEKDCLAFSSNLCDTPLESLQKATNNQPIKMHRYKFCLIQVVHLLRSRSVLIPRELENRPHFESETSTRCSLAKTTY